MVYSAIDACLGEVAAGVMSACSRNGAPDSCSPNDESSSLKEELRPVAQAMRKSVCAVLSSVNASRLRLLRRLWAAMLPEDSEEQDRARDSQEDGDVQYAEELAAHEEELGGSDCVSEGEHAGVESDSAMSMTASDAVQGPGAVADRLPTLEVPDHGKRVGTSSSSTDESKSGSDEESPMRASLEGQAHGKTAQLMAQQQEQPQQRSTIVAQLALESLEEILCNGSVLPLLVGQSGVDSSGGGSSVDAPSR
jgi:hypothetical protein